jgi:hypothetical protein
LNGLLDGIIAAACERILNVTLQPANTHRRSEDFNPTFSSVDRAFEEEEKVAWIRV